MTTYAPLSTVNDLFLRVASAGNPRAVLWQDEFGQWQPISSNQIYQRVWKLGETLLDWGVRKGDRIALISENRWEWAITDFATLAIGAVNVPIYPTLTGEQIAVLIKDADCRVGVLSTRQQFDKLNVVREQTPLERILMMDSATPASGAIALSEVLAGADARGSERDPVFDALVRSAQPRDLATLIYTSGTTGEPKGVMLTHGNIAANQNYAAADFDFNATDACISFLPLSHITARALDYVMYGRRGAGGLLLAVRQAAAGHERGEADGVCGRSACLRKNSTGSGAEVGGVVCEEEDAGMGSQRRGGAAGVCVCGNATLVGALETGQQADLQQGTRGLRRAGPLLGFGRSAAGNRHREVVCRCGDSLSGKDMGSPKHRR